METRHLGQASAFAADGNDPVKVIGAVMTPVIRQSNPPPIPVHNVRAYGATGDGVTDDTAALRQAIAACAGTGGSVVLDHGVFRAANLELKSGMTLYVAARDEHRFHDIAEDLEILVVFAPAEVEPGA